MTLRQRVDQKYWTHQGVNLTKLGYQELMGLLSDIDQAIHER